MAAEQINIDLAQTVNIECIERDTFDLSLNIKNLDDTNYNFSNDDLVVFNVYDTRGQIIFLCASEVNINNESLDILSSDSYHGLSFAESEEEKLIGRDRGQALATVLSCNKKLVTGIFAEGKWSVPSNQYQLISCNRDASIDIQHPKYSYSLLQPCITYTSGIIKINIQSNSFLLPEGKYNYEIKLLSNLISSYSTDPTLMGIELEGFEGGQFPYNENVAEYNAHNYLAESVYNNSKTWLNGAITVKKY